MNLFFFRFDSRKIVSYNTLTDPRLVLRPTDRPTEIDWAPNDYSPMNIFFIASGNFSKTETTKRQIDRTESRKKNLPIYSFPRFEYTCTYVRVCTYRRKSYLTTWKRPRPVFSCFVSGLKFGITKATKILFFLLCYGISIFTTYSTSWVMWLTSVSSYVVMRALSCVANMTTGRNTTYVISLFSILICSHACIKLFC